MYPHTEQKKIPTPLALLMLVGIIVGVSALAQRPATNISHASAQVLIEYKATNITYRSVSLYWQTDKPTTGWIAYGKSADKLDTIALDDRDVSNAKQQYKNHYVSLNALSPHTKYYVSLISDDGILEPQKMHMFETGKPSLSNNATPGFGKIVTPSGNALKNGIVLLTIEGAEPLSTITKDDGEFLIPTYYLLKQGTTELFYPDSKRKTELKIIDENGTISTVKTIYSEMSPIKDTIILGKKYDFTEPESTVLGVTTQVSPTPQEKINTIDIIFPTQNAVIPGSRPFYKGTAIAGNSIVLTITPVNQMYQLVADKDGVWSVTSAKLLLPGTYSLILKTKDAKGKDVKISHNFTIQKNGEAVLGEATQSGTLSLTPTISLLPTPTVVVASASPTLIPTVTPIPTGSLPRTGNSFLGVAAASVSMIFLGIGMIMIF